MTNLYLCWAGPCSDDRLAELLYMGESLGDPLSRHTWCFHANEVSDLGRQLQSMGFSLAQVPQRLGGECLLAELFDQWMSQQLERDKQRHSTMLLEGDLVQKREQVHQQEKRDFAHESARSRRRKRRHIEKEEFKRLQDKFLDLSATKLRLGEEERWLRTTVVGLGQLLSLQRASPGGPAVWQTTCPSHAENAFLQSPLPTPVTASRGTLPSQDLQSLLDLFQQRFASCNEQLSVAEVTAGSLGAQRQIAQLHQAGWSSLFILEELRNQVLAVVDGSLEASAGLLSLFFLFQALLVHDSSQPCAPNDVVQPTPR